MIEIRRAFELKEAEDEARRRRLARDVRMRRREKDRLQGGLRTVISVDSVGSDGGVDMGEVK